MTCESALSIGWVVIGLIIGFVVGAISKLGRILGASIIAGVLAVAPAHASLVGQSGRPYVPSSAIDNNGSRDPSPAAFSWRR